MKQTFDFDNLNIGDRVKLHGIVAEYTDAREFSAERLLAQDDTERGHVQQAVER